jgi:hypothetical protein
MPPISKTLTTLLGGVVLSLMCASTAGASCADPSQPLVRTLLTPPRAGAPAAGLAQGGQFGRIDNDDRAHSGRLLDRIVGTWHVTYGGIIASEAFIQWHSDGTEWENIDLPTLGGNICMGDWRAVDQDHVRRSHVGWRFSNGIPAGSFTWTETNEVARDGSWYRGTYQITLFDDDGTQVAQGAGTAEATRIPAP